MTATIDAHRAAALEQAFALFNEHSRELQSSWEALQSQVAELTRQRDAADQARLQELAAKECLAERLQALLEALPGAAIMLDPDGRICECNAGARELLGEPLPGRAWKDIAARALRAESDLDGTPRLADGRRLNVSRRTLPGGGSVLLLTDDSEAHARRSGVERQRRQADLDSMNARLAHQLRTPLATAVLYLSRVAGGDLDAPTSSRLAGKALDRLRDLQRLIDDTLALARGETGEAETIVLSGLLDELRRQADCRAPRDRQIHFDRPVDGLRVRGQRQLLCSALLNLVENALAFAPRVEVVIRHDDHHVHLQVRDNGPGIDSDTATRIFEPFFTTRDDGNGLGLSMARAVARAHGGDLLLAPARQGACFVLTLPRAENGAWLGSGTRLAPAIPRAAEVHA